MESKSLWGAVTTVTASDIPRRIVKPKPHLYAFVLGIWALSMVWFYPRLWGLMDLAHTPFQKGSLIFFIVFMQIAWLYAFFNLGVLIFASIYRRRHAHKHATVGELPAVAPAVALLYTTCNDFVERSAETCVIQDYPDYTVYICDDSSLDEHKQRIDAFAAKYPERVKVIRRPDRKGFKAGNINNALGLHAVDEPFFAIADADEILPRDFLRRLVPRLLQDETCGFVQANHRSNPEDPSPLAKSMGVGIDIHWRWYHPLRNEYGFVMLLGHGAVLRRKCWEECGGFPELVSEDLAYALKIRELGYRGHFAEDVVCFEDFPENIRAFRVRHMKWTRGTCEFLKKQMFPALLSRKLPWVEKLDILLPTLNLPLALFYFLFVIDANLILTTQFAVDQPVTFEGGVLGHFVFHTRRFDEAFGALGGPDFYAITLLTLLAPVLCFIVDLARRPRQLVPFLSRSTAVYGALAPLSCLGVLFYMITGKAVFHVTADRKQDSANTDQNKKRPSGIKKFFAGSHPDHAVVQGFEVATGLTFGALCMLNFQIAFLGLCIGFIMLPILHRVSWDAPVVRSLVHLPFALIVTGMVLGAMAVAGMQTVFFGYGFHF